MRHPALLSLFVFAGCANSSHSSGANDLDGSNVREEGGGGSRTKHDGGISVGGNGGNASSNGGNASSNGGNAGSAGAGGSAGSSPTDASPVQYDATAPTPPAEWVAITNDVAGLTSECGNVDGVYPDTSSDALFASIARQGLFRSTDGGDTWTLTGKGGDPILNRGSQVVHDPAHPMTFWYTGIYGWESPFTNSVFITTDRGLTFKGYSTLATIQSANDSVAIDFSDPDRKTMLAGGHEQKQVLFLSTDAGTTWKDIGKTLPSTTGFCTQTLIVESKTFLVGCAASYSGLSGEILRSTDGGSTWTPQNNGKGISGAPLRASDGTFYFALEGGGVTKSTDQGKTWTAVADSNTAGGLPPFELPDGRIVTTKGKTIVVSADKGKTWTAVGKDIPFTPNNLSYSPFRNAFYATYFTCSGTNDVPADSIQRYGWDYR